MAAEHRLAALPPGEIRPLLVASQGQHKWSVPDDHYDGYAIFEETPPSLESYLDNEQGEYGTYDRFSGTHTLAGQLEHLSDRIKLHLLYTHGIALECPVSFHDFQRPGWSAFSDPLYHWQRPRWELWLRRRLARLSLFLERFEPLIDSGVVVLTPAFRDVQTGQTARSLDNELRSLGLQDSGPNSRRLREEDDPLGPLNGCYADAYQHRMQSWSNPRDIPFEELLRAGRLEATLRGLNATLLRLESHQDALDLFVSRDELPVMRRLLGADTALDRTGLARSAVRSDRTAAMRELSRMRLPTAKLALADIRAIRQDGHFEFFRQALAQSLARAGRLDPEEYFDPESQRLRETYEQLHLATLETLREVGREPWLRTRLLDTTELTVVTSIGVAGSLVSHPTVGAASAATGYLAGKLFSWLKGRSETPEQRTVARHVALFKPSDGSAR